MCEHCINTIILTGNGGNMKVIERQIPLLAITMKVILASVVEGGKAEKALWREFEAYHRKHFGRAIVALIGDPQEPRLVAMIGIAKIHKALFSGVNTAMNAVVRDQQPALEVFVVDFAARWLNSKHQVSWLKEPIMLPN